MDLLDIYYTGTHEFYRRWAALSSPDGTGTTEDPNGFVRFTVTVLGPNDDAPVHDFKAELAAERSKAGKLRLDNGSQHTFYSSWSALFADVRKAV